MPPFTTWIDDFAIHLNNYVTNPYGGDNWYSTLRILFAIYIIYLSIMNINDI